MKIKATFIFTQTLDIPDILAPKNPGEIPDVIKAISTKFAENMKLKHGKDVEVKVEVVES